MTRPIVILRAGDVAPPVAEHRGQFPDWIVRVAGPAWRGGWRTHDVRTEDPLPAIGEAAAFVITGSSSSVTERAPWMLRLETLVRSLVEARAPLFGICFGHQIVAQALGGEVVRNPRGREIGTVSVTRLAVDPVLEHAPERFHVNATHVDAVVRLPAGARVLAASELDPTQAFGIGDTVRCVQFHPEIDGDAMRRYVAARSHLIEAEGGDANAILARSGDAPHAEEILRAFVRRFVAPQASSSAASLVSPLVSSS